MTAIATPFGSNAGKYAFMGSAACVNCYPEIRPDGDKARYVLMAAPGTVSFSAVTDTPCRGALFLEDLNYALSVHSGRVWKVESTGTATSLGIVPGFELVSMARNKKATPQTAICSPYGVYVVEGSTVSKIVNDLLADCVWVLSQGGYTIFLLRDGRFYISASNEAFTIDPLDFATAEQAADGLVAGMAIGDTIYLGGKYTIEPWRNTGNADFPFEPISGATIRVGILAANSLCEFDNSIAWVGLTREGDRAVYRLNGYQAARISTPEVERSISAETTPENIEGMAFSLEGHAFYSISGENFTWIYDAATQRWHKRQSYQDVRWRARSSFQAWNNIIVGDRLTGSLYTLDPDIADEASAPLIWELIFPTMHSFPNGGICDALRLDMLTGHGKVSSAAQGHDPKGMLSKSTDGGNTYGSERLFSLGKSGSYQTRCTVRRLGKFGPQGMTFKLSVSDPVARGLALADAAVRPLWK